MREMTAWYGEVKYPFVEPVINRPELVRVIPEERIKKLNSFFLADNRFSYGEIEQYPHRVREIILNEAGRAFAEKLLEHHKIAKFIRYGDLCLDASIEIIAPPAPLEHL